MPAQTYAYGHATDPLERSAEDRAQAPSLTLAIPPTVGACLGTPLHCLPLSRLFQERNIADACACPLRYDPADTEADDDSHAQAMVALGRLKRQRVTSEIQDTEHWDFPVKVRASCFTYRFVLV